MRYKTISDLKFRITKTFVTVFLIIGTNLSLFGQLMTIRGKVIGAEPGDDRGVYDEFFVIPKATILSGDSINLGTTDENGLFEIKIPSHVNELLFGWIAMDW